MTVTKNDIGVLVYLAQRERPSHAPKWDDAGISKFLHQLVDRGFGFGELLDRTIAHARDRNARTPAVLLHHAAAHDAAITVPRNPTKSNACPDCGLRRTACICDPTVPRKPIVDSRNDDVQTVLSEAREALAAARGGATT